MDGDGDLDIHFANVRLFVEGADRQNRLLLNDGSGAFTDGTADRLPTDSLSALDGDLIDLDGDDRPAVRCDAGGKPYRRAGRLRRGATLQTVERTENESGDSPETIVRSTPVPAFAEAVGQPREEVWDERIWDVVIRIDGDLAAVWVPYAFYLGSALQHCGVNAMQLVRHPRGWKILHLTDTRTLAEACSIPASVRKESGH